MKKRFTEEQIVGLLREIDSGTSVKDMCRHHDCSKQGYYIWRSKFSGIDVTDAKQLIALESENARLKKLLAEAMLENEAVRDVLRKKVVKASAQREVVRMLTSYKLSERDALRIVGMRASTHHYHQCQIIIRH